MKKIFVLLALFLLVNFAFAEDFLAKVSQGALSDTSPGVKKLSLEEMKEIKGGSISKDGKIAPILWALGVSGLSYLNAPTIGGPTYSGQVVPFGNPNRPSWWMKLGF